MSEEDYANIQGVIAQLWATYDVNNSGRIDKQQSKKIVKNTLDNLYGEH